jgi:hypothetical protein
MRKWFGRAASSKERNWPICPRPAQAETNTNAESSCNDTTSPTSGGKLISFTWVTIRETLLVLAERALRSFGKIDYSIRRWVIPDHPSSAISHDSVFPIALSEKQSWGLARSALPKRRTQANHRPRAPGHYEVFSRERGLTPRLQGWWKHKWRLITGCSLLFSWR